MLKVIKIGGNIIDDKAALQSFLQSFAAIEGAKILVHGGGKVATELGNKIGIESHYVNGRRVTDAATLDLVTMVYGGLINKNIVAQLQSLDCNAIGFTGADGNVIKADKRPVKDVDYGYVGDVKATGVNVQLINTLLNTGITPVFAPLTHDGMGNMLNTNADTIAQELAKAMAGVTDVKLIYCFEKKGLLMDADDDASVISSVNTDEYERLKQQNVIFGGMIPKLDNAFAAINSGVKNVILGHADDLHQLISGQAGTQIQ